METWSRSDLETCQGQTLMGIHIKLFRLTKGQTNEAPRDELLPGNSCPLYQISIIIVTDQSYTGVYGHNSVPAPEGQRHVRVFGTNLPGLHLRVTNDPSVTRNSSSGTNMLLIMGTFQFHHPLHTRMGL